jgi:hypothetical protein
MLSDCKLIERFNRQDDAWTVGTGSIQLRQVRIVETARLTSLRLWVGRVVKILTSAISSSILRASWGWSSRYPPQRLMAPATHGPRVLLWWERN